MMADIRCDKRAPKFFDLGNGKPEDLRGLAAGCLRIIGIALSRLMFANTIARDR